MSAPFFWTWDGEAMWPLPYFRAQADKDFVIGETYRLEHVEDRSVQSHKHYFVALREAFNNLPEEHRGRWRTIEHLRKHALIRTGYHTKISEVLHSKAEAQRFARFALKLDEYAWVEVEGTTAVVYTAKSQSQEAMKGKEFQQSKTAVLEYVSTLIGVPIEELLANAGRAA